jgi:hypothetical protein
MESITHTTDIYCILDINKERIARIIGEHDQLTGYGMPGHDYKCEIKGYPIFTQYLTQEVYEHPLYKDLREVYSIRNYIAWRKKEHGETLTTEDVTRALMLVRLQNDPSFAFELCYRIKSKQTGEMVPFRLNYAQRILLEELERMRLAGVPIRIILLKARQWGGSTLVQLYMSWIQLFVMEGWYSVIIAQTKDTAKRIKAMYKKVLDEFPSRAVFGIDGLKFSPYEHSAADSIITDLKGTIIRDNVITIASYENFESTRGMDYAMAHFSECAYWTTTESKSAEKVITNIDSNILEKPLTIEISESTANGMSGYFYDEYQLAKEGKSSRKAIFIPFFYIENDMLYFKDEEEKKAFVIWLLENKDNDVAPDETHESGKYLYSLWEKGATLEHIKWYIQKRESFHDHASMASEAPSDDIECFKYSGHLVFHIHIIDELRKKYVRTPILIGDITENHGKLSLRAETSGSLSVWKQPDETPTNHQYMVIVDVGGRSNDADPSCITVIDRWPLRFKGGKMEVVARWHGHIRYDHLAYKAVRIARYYKNALLVFESNTFDKKKAESTEFVEQGDHIRGILQKIGDSYRNLYMRASTNPEDIKNGILQKIGFQTNVKTKQDMVDIFITTFEDDKFIDPDARFYKEASIYEQRPNGSYGNIVGKNNHDDILMTDMIGTLVNEELPKPTIRKDYSISSRRGTRNESDI